MHVLWLSSFHPYPHDACSSAVIVPPLSSRCLFCSCHHSISASYSIPVCSLSVCILSLSSWCMFFLFLHDKFWFLMVPVLYLSVSYPYLHDACSFYVCMLNSGSSWYLFFICLHYILLLMMNVYIISVIIHALFLWCLFLSRKHPTPVWWCQFFGWKHASYPWPHHTCSLVVSILPLLWY